MMSDVDSGMVVDSIGASIIALQGLALFWGACWGSFINVVIYRLPEGLSLVRPGSHCTACQAPIAWFDNLPVVSYFVLRGRCRHCKQSYSPRYMLVELACGLLVLVLFRATVLPLNPDTFGAGFALWMWTQVFVYGLVAITFIDLAHTTIPLALTVPSTIIGIAGGFLVPGLDGWSLVWGAAAGCLFLLFVYGLGWIMYRREAMGLGDVALLTMIGAFLGWSSLPFVVLAASVQGLLASLLAIVWSRVRKQPNQLVMTTRELDDRFDEAERFEDLPVRQAIPFGPFLALAGLEALLFGSEPFWAVAERFAHLVHGATI